MLLCSQTFFISTFPLDKHIRLNLFFLLATARCFFGQIDQDIQFFGDSKPILSVLVIVPNH